MTKHENKAVLIIQTLVNAAGADFEDLDLAVSIVADSLEKDYHAEQLRIGSVVKSFTATDVERAYDDGYSTDGEVTFDIDNYS
jgi:hypothetical protein